MSDKNVMLSFKSAVPFWSSVLFAIAIWASFIIQGWAILLVPVFTLLILPIIDQYVGLRVENLDTNLKRISTVLVSTYNSNLGSNPISYIVWYSNT